MSVYVRPIHHRESAIMVPVDIQARYAESTIILPETEIHSDYISDPIDVSQYSKLRLFMNVKSLSGVNASLTLKVEAQDPASQGWVEVNSSGPVTAPGLYTMKHDVYEKMIRIRVALSGASPSARISVGMVMLV